MDRGSRTRIRPSILRIITTDDNGSITGSPSGNSPRRYYYLSKYRYVIPRGKRRGVRPMLEDIERQFFFAFLVFFHPSNPQGNLTTGGESWARRGIVEFCLLAEGSRETLHARRDKFLAWFVGKSTGERKGGSQDLFTSRRGGWLIAKFRVLDRILGGGMTTSRIFPRTRRGKYRISIRWTLLCPRCVCDRVERG